jgi:16S rRNA G966 N2-methylase RsmD
MARCPAASFELVFIDPPFDSEAIAPALDAALRVVVEGGYIYLEAAHAFPPEAAVQRGLRIHRQSRAGAVHFHLLQRVATAVIGHSSGIALP